MTVTWGEQSLYKEESDLPKAKASSPGAVRKENPLWTKICSRCVRNNKDEVRKVKSRLYFINYTYYWDNWRLICSCKKYYREIPCTLFPVSPDENMLQNYTILSPHRISTFINPLVLFSFPSFIWTHFWVFVHEVLHNFITCIFSCIQHHSEENVQLQHQRTPTWPF